MASRSTWLKRGLVVFLAAIVLRGLANQKPDELAIIAAMAVLFITVTGMGWLFAVKRER